MTETLIDMQIMVAFNNDEGNRSNAVCTIRELFQAATGLNPITVQLPFGPYDQTDREMAQKPATEFFRRLKLVG